MVKEMMGIEEGEIYSRSQLHDAGIRCLMARTGGVYTALMGKFVYHFGIRDEFYKFNGITPAGGCEA